MASRAGALAFPTGDQQDGNVPFLERNDPTRRSDREQLLNGQTPEVRIVDSTPPFEEEVEARTLIDEKPKKQEFSIHDPTPPDRFYLVYFIFVIHGIGVLLPWNAFITAERYFVSYKLGGTAYGKNFLSYLGICSQLPNLLLNMLNLFIQVKGSLARRIISCLTINCFMIVLTIVLAVIDSSDWPGMFFLVTMGTVILLNASNGMYQNSVYGLAADFPPNYTNAVVFGNNVCGTFVSLVNIICMLISPGIKMAAVYYFIASLFVLLLCLDSYFVLPYCRFFRCFHDKGWQRRNGEKHRVHDKDLAFHHTGCWARVQNAFRPYVVVFKEAWVHLWNVFFIFFVSLTVFPAMQANIEPLQDDFPISKNFYAAITCFLLFNSTAMLGNFIANFVQFPGPRFLWLPVLLRGLMIPYFMLCNYRPTLRTWDVYFNDWAYIGMAILMGLTSGYFSSLAMMYAPRVVDPDKARVAGMMAALFLVLGIFGGVYFTLVVAHINENFGPLVPLASLNSTITNGTLLKHFI